MERSAERNVASGKNGNAAGGRIEGGGYADRDNWPFWREKGFK